MNRPPPTAVYDACVLYPAPLRDLLMWLALAGLVQARWSRQIHDEWTRNVLAHRPDLKRTQIERTVTLMDRALPDALVRGHESLIDDLHLRDPDDRHVLAAAIRAKASVIVTFNTKDFAARVLKRFGIEAQHPDAFVYGLMQTDPAGVVAAVQRQRKQLKNPPIEVREFLAIVRRQGLTRTAEALAAFSAAL